MKLFLLGLALVCAARGQFGDARSLQRLPIKPALVCTNGQVVTWVAARYQFECQAAAAGGATITSPNGTITVGGTPTNPTLDTVATANARCTFAAASTCSITGLTGVVNKAVVSCFDNSGSLVEIIPNDFIGSTADTLVVNFSAAQTGYCNASTGVGATGATGPTGTGCGSLGGDLSGTCAAATTVKINGVSVTGTPSVGYVPTATSGSAATWQAAGGGASPGAPDNSIQYRVNGTTLGGSLVSFDPSVVGERTYSSDVNLNGQLTPGGTYTDTANPRATFDVVIDGQLVPQLVTTLNGAIDDMVSTIVVSTAVVPNGTYGGNVLAQIDTGGSLEIMCLETVVGTTWTVDRGCFGSAFTHLSGVVAETVADTFKWRKNAGTYTTGVAVTGSAQTLSDGVTVTFSNPPIPKTIGDTWTVLTGASYIKTANGQIIASFGTGGPAYQEVEFGRDAIELYGRRGSTGVNQTASAAIGNNYWYFRSSQGTTEIPTTSLNNDQVGAIFFLPYNGGFGGGLAISAVVTSAADQAVRYRLEQQSGLGTFDTDFNPDGSTTLPGKLDIGHCTAAAGPTNLATVLTSNGDQCMCTDCQPTSGTDDTCAGSGGVWLVYKTASAVVCR